jgi:type IV secretory pathway VirB2 component (pilin)
MSNFFQRALFRLTLAATLVSTSVPRLFAQLGADEVQIEDLQEGTGDPKQIIINVLQWVLSFLALIAVIYIVVAGIRLIVSQGEEEQRKKAKDTILYVVIGLIVVLLAKVIVNFAVGVPAEFNN